MDCNVRIERFGKMEWISAINEARYALMNNTDEKIVITDCETGAILFHYERHAVQ